MNKYFFIFSLVILFSSCSEETQINEISGFIYQDCDYTPMVNAEIVLRSRIGDSFDEISVIGAAISNSNGRFQFTYELGEDEKGTADLVLVSSSGFQDLLTDLNVNIDINSNIYVPNKSSVFVNLSGTKVFSTFDTLYIGVSESNFSNFIIQPAAGRIDTIQIEVPNLYNESKAYTLYYGLGLNQFKATRDSLSSTNQIRNFNLDLTGCNKEESVDLVID